VAIHDEVERVASAANPIATGPPIVNDDASIFGQKRKACPYPNQGLPIDIELESSSVCCWHIMAVPRQALLIQ
jgi:hypothetical protein